MFFFIKVYFYTFLHIFSDNLYVFQFLFYEKVLNYIVTTNIIIYPKR